MIMQLRYGSGGAMEEKIKESGTTVLGLIYKNGVVLASDTQSTAAYIESRMERKIFPITSHIAVGTAGVVGDLQFLVRLLKVEAKLYRMGNGEITTKALATLLSNILHANRLFPFITAMVIGGYDKKRGPQLFAIDPFGGVGTGEKYFVTGSGAPLALGVIESSYREDMSEKEAVELARKAIMTARERDVFSGGKKILIAVIDEKGYREIE